MSYTPTEWETGDVVTAEKLNKLEGQVEDISLIQRVIINMDPTTKKLDKTFKQIYDLLASGYAPCVRLVESDVYNNEEAYQYKAGFVEVNMLLKYGASEYRLYAYSNTIKSISYSGTNYYSVGKPAMLTFIASGPTDYPELKFRLFTNDASVGQDNPSTIW